ncbi:uncharacterized protein [Hyperolius riggenbachi]
MTDKDSIVGIKKSFDPSPNGKNSKPASVKVTTEKCPPQEDPETLILINEKQDLQESTVDKSPIQDEDNIEEVILTLVPETNTETPLQATDNYVLPAIPNTPRNTSLSNVSTPDDIHSNAVPVHISRSRQSICRTRNLDKEQNLFDREQSQRIHETQQQYRIEMTQRIDAIYEQLVRYNNAYTQFSAECVREFQRECIENMQAIRKELLQCNQWYSDYLQDTKLYRAKKLDALTKQNSMLTEIILNQNQQLSTIFTLPEM